MRGVLISGLAIWMSLNLKIVQPVSTVDINDLLDQYGAGKYSDVRTRVAATHVATTLRCKDFSNTAGRWLKTHSSDRDRIVAASVALEIAHQLRFEPPDRPADYLIWAGNLITKTRPVSLPGVERQWFLAALSGMQELSEPWMLPLRVEGVDAKLNFKRDDIPAGGFAAIAVQRFPDEPRFRLISIDEAADGPFSDLSYTPNLLAFLQHVASISANPSPATRVEAEIAGFRYNANRWLAVRAGAYQAIDRYRALADPAIQADVAVRIGRLQAGQAQWEEARKTLDPLLDRTTPAPLGHLARLILARSYRALGRHDEAIRALRDALRLVPRARTASVLLAAELMASALGVEAQREASDVMDAAFSDPAAFDPWSIVVYGDAYLWEAHMAALQELLR